jgi:hypothetical protein
MALTLSEQELIEEFADSKPAVQTQARTRYSLSEAYQSQVVSKYRDLHHYYNPLNQDHWPQDVALRPGKIHTTSNLCKAAVDVDARLQSIPPRITIPVATLSPDERKRAEAAEALLLLWLDLSGFDTWLNTLCQVKSIYGKGVLKPYWDDKLKRGDVSVIENPANLRLGWGSSDYKRIDWALYQYGLSYQEIALRWPEVKIDPGRGQWDPPDILYHQGDHSDPLAQKDDEFWRPFYRNLSEYERTQIRVWDYWYKKSDGVVCNAAFLNGTLIDGPYPHPELADIPYIVIEQDHEPGSPEGIATIEPIMNLQDEFNRLLSHGLQHIADDVDPAWYLSGPSADTVPVGIVPKAGEVTGVGENRVDAWPKSVNVFPIQEMMNELWNEFHRLTGLPEILFGQTPGADTSGRAIAIQVEAAANRLDPRRRRLYNGLKELLVFWTIMSEEKDPKIEVGKDEETGAVKTVGVGALVKGFRTWKIIAPEITPRDNFEVTQNETNKVNAKLSSLRSAMNQIGVEAPEAELAIIAQEQANLKLNPAAVQAQISVLTIAAQLEQMQMQNEQMRAQIGQLSAGGPQQPPGSILNPEAGQAALAAQQAQAQPTAFEDQNQPMTQAGTPPPQGAPPPGGNPAALTALTRQGQGMQQIAFNAFGGGNA